MTACGKMGKMTRKHFSSGQAALMDNDEDMDDVGVSKALVGAVASSFGKLKKKAKGKGKPPVKFGRKMMDMDRE